MNDKQRLIRLIKEKAFQRADVPTFRLSSGKMSCYYFNLRFVTMSSKGLVLIGKLVLDKIQELDLKPDAVGGLTMGADPIAHALALTSELERNPIQSFSVRKEPKGHGLGLQVEGNVKENDRVVIVEDVVTTGGSTIKAVTTGREYGLNVLGVIVLLDRCEENGRENIEAQGVPVHSILTIQDFLE